MRQENRRKRSEGWWWITRKELKDAENSMRKLYDFCLLFKWEISWQKSVLNIWWLQLPYFFCISVINLSCSIHTKTISFWTLKKLNVTQKLFCCFTESRSSPVCASVWSACKDQFGSIRCHSSRKPTEHVCFLLIE